MVDVNLANVVKEFKEAMVEQEPTTFYRFDNFYQ